MAGSRTRSFWTRRPNPCLWVSIDRVALKPPVRPGRPGYDQPGFIDWDTDINRHPDIPFRRQGVLALEDTSA